MFIPTIILFLISVIAGYILLQKIAISANNFRAIYILLASAFYTTMLVIYLKTGESIFITTCLVIATALIGGSIFFIDSKGSYKINDG